MPGPLDLQAPTAAAYFAALVADDADFPLLEAAIAVGQDEDPALDVQGVLVQVDALAARLVRRIPADAAPLARLRLLNRYFFGELGFAGNVNHYEDPRNSYLHEVLRTRRGIPITLALLYVELATRAGLVAHGVSFPGHFLVKLRLPAGEVVIDPFSGRSLSREDLIERLAPWRQAFGGEVEPPLAPLLRAATARETLARVLRNLKTIHRAAGDRERLAAVLQRLVAVLPRAWEEYRDLAWVLAELGRDEEARAAGALYLQHRPGAADAGALRERLQTGRRLH
jgi:regulator of sirC expression with transglutaminase-like and TPR domain